MTYFYEFNQNNSEGSCIYDSENGIGTYIYIEAHDVDEANERAEEIGIYFDGIDDGIDCECCGDRWTRAKSWHKPLNQEQLKEQTEDDDLEPYGDDIYIHFLDGSFKTLTEYRSNK